MNKYRIVEIPYKDKSLWYAERKILWFWFHVQESDSYSADECEQKLINRIIIKEPHPKPTVYKYLNIEGRLREISRAEYTS
jgi:hypothetical protein